MRYPANEKLEILRLVGRITRNTVKVALVMVAATKQRQVVKKEPSNRAPRSRHQ